MTHTKDILARVLRKAGLHEMADKAEAGHYHDFLSPLPYPELELDRDLIEAGTPAALAIRERHHAGEFDASLEESDDWIRSPEGQSALAELSRGSK